MSRLRRQSGATLIVTLIILITMTLFAVASSQLVSTDLRIAGNVQGKKLAEAATQQAVETVLSSGSYFTSPVAHRFSVAGLTVATAAPTCLALSSVSGYFMTSSTQTGMAPVNTRWDIQASTSDPVTGAAVVLHQGVAMRMRVGSVCQ